MRGTAALLEKEPDTRDRGRGGCPVKTQTEFGNAEADEDMILSQGNR